MWLVIFPEGTRYNPTDQGKLQKSWKYCDSIGIQRLNNVLAPHSTGFEVIYCTAAHGTVL